MLDVTDKGTINQVVAYSNSANANISIQAFDIFQNFSLLMVGIQILISLVSIKIMIIVIWGLIFQNERNILWIGFEMKKRQLVISLQNIN